MDDPVLAGLINTGKVSFVLILEIETYIFIQNLAHLLHNKSENSFQRVY